MKKYILLLILLIVAGCISQQNNFTYNTKSCGQPPKVAKENTVYFTQEGIYTKFTQILNSYCSDRNKLYLNYKIKGRYITITESLYVKDVVECICPMEIRGQIESLGPGTYSIKFVLENKETGKIENLHEIDYTVD